MEPGAARFPPAASGATLWAWSAYCGALLLWSGALTALSGQFGYEREVRDMPILAAVALLAAAGLIFCAVLPRLISNASIMAAGMQHRVLGLVVLAGLAARLVFLASDPILENDFERYLWDGAVVADGRNPYQYAPRDVIRDGADGPLTTLARDGAETLSRIGHKSLTTIYPPVAQAMFALAHMIEPWSLTAWRCLLIVFDIVAVFLLIRLLYLTGRSRLWVAVYWLNPLVLKEGFNSAHMEPALAPFVLGAILLAWHGRCMASTVILALAAGIKLWPAALVPLLWRHLSLTPKVLALNALVFGLFIASWIAPLLLSAPSEQAGLKAYAEGWSTNSALLPALERLIAAILPGTAVDAIRPGLIARGLVAAVLGALALWLATRDGRSLNDLIRRVTIFVMALVLLSPAQYPWYALWLAPLLVFWPHPAFLLLSATLPLYYLSFYFTARDAHDTFTGLVVWLIWCPVWMMLATRFIRPLRSAVSDGQHAASGLGR